MLLKEWLFINFYLPYKDYSLSSLIREANDQEGFGAEYGIKQGDMKPDSVDRSFARPALAQRCPVSGAARFSVKRRLGHMDGRSLRRRRFGPLRRTALTLITELLRNQRRNYKN